MRSIPVLLLLALSSAVLVGCEEETIVVPRGLDVEIVPDSATISVGETREFAATVTNPPRWTSPTITWTSSDVAVAVVSSDGVVTGKGPGVALVTATARAGSKRGTDAAALRVTFSTRLPVLRLAPETTTASVGGQVQFTASGFGTNPVLTCTSSNTTVATAETNASGCIATARAVGTTVITASLASDPNLKASSTLSVSE